ncbi:MAG: transposase [Armatimonadetes bacterium]|nr:transposase [Armatimonadota bacterium]
MAKEPLSQKFKTFARRRSLRLPHFDYAQPFVCYHLIIGTYQAQSFLVEPQLNNKLVEHLQFVANAYGYLVLAYCIMPDHVHILVQACEECRSLQEFVAAWKAKTTSEFRQHGHSGKLWQRGFYDRILRKDEEIATICDYIWGNPVRAGLVDEPHEYPWLGKIHEPIM